MPFYFTFFFLIFVPVHLSACSNSSKDTKETVSSATETNSSTFPVELPKEIFSSTYSLYVTPLLNTVITYSPYILIRSLVIGSPSYTYPYLLTIHYAIKNIVKLTTPGYDAPADDEFFLALTAFLHQNGMPKIETNPYFPDPSPIIKSVPIDNTLSNSSEIVNLGIDTVVSTTTVLSSNSEIIAPVTFVLDTLIDVASK